MKVITEKLSQAYVLALISLVSNATTASPTSFIGGSGASYSPDVEDTTYAQAFLGYMRGSHPEAFATYEQRIPAGNTPDVGLRVFVYEGFSPQAMTALREAAQLFMSYALNMRVMSCAFNNVEKLPGRPTRTSIFAADMFRYFQHFDRETRRRKVYITHFYHYSTDIQGVARVNTFSDTGRGAGPSSYYFHVSLNAAYIERSVNDPAEIAGVLAHEILHNFGFTHPHYDATNERRDFIYQYGDCLAQEARRNSP
ncbi:MAG: hypothetical protein RIC85_04480 [Gammaproteobacteria bacterium]